MIRHLIEQPAGWCRSAEIVELQMKHRMGENYEKAYRAGFCGDGCGGSDYRSFVLWSTGGDSRAERSASTISQSTDRAEARIAILKADLRLSPDQAQHWAGLKSALHDIVAKRAKSWAASHDTQTGRASSNAPVAPDISITEDEQRRDTNRRDARKARLDDIDEMRREADAYTVQAAVLRQIADAAQPLYDTLDDRQRHRLVQFVREDLRANRSGCRECGWKSAGA